MKKNARRTQRGQRRGNLPTPRVHNTTSKKTKAKSKKKKKEKKHTTGEEAAR